MAKGPQTDDDAVVGLHRRLWRVVGQDRARQISEALPQTGVPRLHRRVRHRHPGFTNNHDAVPDRQHNRSWKPGQQSCNTGRSNAAGYACTRQSPHKSAQRQPHLCVAASRGMVGIAWPTMYGSTTTTGACTLPRRSELNASRLNSSGRSDASPTEPLPLDAAAAEEEEEEDAVALTLPLLDARWDFLSLATPVVVTSAAKHHCSMRLTWPATTAARRHRADAPRRWCRHTSTSTVT